MERVYNYQRLCNRNAFSGQVFDLGNAGSFTGIMPKECIPRDDFVIDGAVFECIHVIENLKHRPIFTAYRSDDEPGVLLIVWREYPYYQDIEEGGDFMLQVMATDSRVRNLIIDNTYVRSGWMNDKMSDYLNNGWMPGLVELGLESFCHLQAESYLGGVSFLKFGELVSENISTISQKLGKRPFNYYPLKTSDISEDGRIDEKLRARVMKKALDIVRTSAGEFREA